MELSSSPELMESLSFSSLLWLSFCCTHLQRCCGCHCFARIIYKLHLFLSVVFAALMHQGPPSCSSWCCWYVDILQTILFQHNREDYFLSFFFVLLCLHSSLLLFVLPHLDVLEEINHTCCFHDPFLFQWYGLTLKQGNNLLTSCGADEVCRGQGC